MSRDIKWDFDAWKDYLSWQNQDKNTLKKINSEHRLVYAVDETTIYIIACKGHYN